jgi:hypothetical protein
MFKYQKFITRQDLKDNPDTLYVFGDNLERVGLGGQAAEMRGEPNAVGIPTKRSPGMEEEDFFDNSVECFREFLAAIQPELMLLMTWDGDIVWPEDGIGTGLAELRKRSKRVWKFISELEDSLEEAHS